MYNNANISLGNTLAQFFDCVTKNYIATDQSAFFQAITSIFYNKPNTNILSFALDDKTTALIINRLKENLRNKRSDLLNLFNAPLTYLLDELICNIQQHAQTDTGYAYLDYDKNTDSVEIIIADFGITIYGSYVAMQKHLDKLGDSDAEALNLVQNGYSVKNRPNAENRGYGIPSNMKMVAEGLHGEFAVFSGNALLLQTIANRKILSLPAEIDFKGTMIMVRIPADVPNTFNMYDYIS